MGRLKELLGMFLYVLAASPVALRIVTGIVALTAVWLLVSLMLAFPVFFAAIFILCVLAASAYYLGYVVWEIIES